MPESFGAIGYFRGDNVQEWANLSPSHAEPQECNNCHSGKFNPWNQGAHKTVSCENCHGPGETHIAGSGQPALKVDRSRSLCVVCHEKLTSRPATHPQIVSADHNARLACVTCHNPHSPALGPRPVIPHSVQGIQDCLACHGPQGLKPVPQDHAGRTTDMCLLCHTVGQKPTPTPTPAVGQPASASPTATAVPSGGPPKIPHNLEGRSDCLMCHGTGLMGAPTPPASHAGRTSDMCRLCHQPAQAPVTTSTPTPTPTPTAETSASASTTVTAVPSGGPPKIPHSLEGRSDCLMCHGTGLMGAPTPPANHAGRTSDMCRLCHQPGATQ